MVSTSVPDPPGAPADRGPSSDDADLAAVFGPSDPETIRRTHLRDESYLKAVGRANYLYALFFGAGVVYFMRLTFLQLSGRINAPWSIRPAWIAYEANGGVLALTALVAGYGFRRLRRWAMAAEGLFVVSFLVGLPLSILAQSRPPAAGEFVGEVLLMAAFLVPMINLWDVRRSGVFAPQYRRVVAATPGVRVVARLSWELKLVMLVLFVVATTVLALSIVP